jgi:predicted Zn-dependent protease
VEEEAAARRRGIELQERGEVREPARAIPLLEMACDLAPDERPVRLALADALGLSGRIDEARTMLRAIIDDFAGRRPKERAPVHYHLARLDLVVGDRPRALVELDAAVKKAGLDGGLHQKIVQDLWDKWIMLCTLAAMTTHDIVHVRTTRRTPGRFRRLPTEPF